MSTSTFAFEIGTEELPAFDLQHATAQLSTLAETLFTEANIEFNKIQIFTTPRRLIVLVEGLSMQTKHIHEEHKGPAAAIAFDGEGNPTKAAIGFARGKGLDVDALEQRTIDGTDYLYSVKEIEPRETKVVLPELLLDLIHQITWPKSMRWSTQTEFFSRPVRWLLALFGNEVIPVKYAGLISDNKTYGHRFLSPGPFEVATADDLIDVLKNSHVVPSESLRKQLIEEEVADVEQATGLTCKIPEKTLTEVINLTEYPTVLQCEFEKEFLTVPEEIIVDAMLMHQRYFPLYDASNKLTNHFIVVMNGNPECKDEIIRGNERVVRPRLSDAKFFYEEDLKKPLEEYVSHLDEVVFQESLGTMRAKTERITALAAHLADNADLSAADKQDVLRAAHLCKADLVTNAVIEFTSVQGIMGAYYAEAAGETDQVAQAIAEHYRPKFAGDQSPATTVGKIVAFADKLDTICGLFAVDQAPTGSSDPFALRRNAIGIVSMLLEGLEVSLDEAIEASLGTFTNLSFDAKMTYDQVREFFQVRIKGIMRDKGLSLGAIEAVMNTGLLEPGEILLRIQALEEARKIDPVVMDDLATAYARANNLTDASLGTQVDVALMGDAERTLFESVEQVRSVVTTALSSRDYLTAFKSLAALRGPIDTFFEDVLIMDSNVDLKNNRLRLLNTFVAVFSGVADFGALSKQ